MSRKLEDLIPILAIKATELIKKAREQEIDVLITSTWRSFAEQQALYDQGRTQPGRVVTWAKPGQSYHNYGLAFDFVPVVEGTPDWETEKTFVTIGQIAEDMRMQWGGRWPGVKRDLPHIQMSFGFSLTELQSFYKIGGIAKVWEECNLKYEKGIWP